MLTRCFEKGREKCDQYWPNDTVPVYYGDIKVQILNDSHYPDWVTTEFMICRGNEQRIIRHFHFTTWPDFGVPNPPQTLARFVRAFRERVGPDQRPIVVHCSAGVGRSGTFITLDRILQQIQVSDFVDIFGIVWVMRKGMYACGHSQWWPRLLLRVFFLFENYFQNEFGWFKLNNNTFVFINVFWPYWKAKKISLVHQEKSMTTKDMKVG